MITAADTQTLTLQVGGKPILPGAAYLEMAAAASSRVLLPTSAASKTAGKQAGREGGAAAARAGLLGVGQMVALEGCAFMSPCVLPTADSGASLLLQVQVEPMAGGYECGRDESFPNFKPA